MQGASQGEEWTGPGQSQVFLVLEHRNRVFAAGCLTNRGLDNEATYFIY